MKSENSAVKKTAKNKQTMTPIAIIGMASLFPQARNLPEYWDNILNKVDSIVDVPASRWDINDYYDPNPTTPDKSYCKRGGFIPDVEFDPGEFGLPPNLLEVTDVSQLLSLVVAKECLEDAGYGEGKEFSRDTTGVILGMVGIGSKIFAPLMARLQYPIWERVLRSYGIPETDLHNITEKIKLAYPQWEENSFPGAIGNIVAGRIANRFDLGATNCVVDAACGTSLAALRMAVSELVEGRADMMISGGVDTDNSIGTYLCFSKTPAFSKGQSLRAFDKDADGMLAGEGIGMVVMKRLEDAERDGDRIYAVIKGIGSSSDGRFKSIYAPRPSGQAKAVRRAYDEAGFSPTTVGLLEAHGTGTMTGDPVEVNGLNEVFAENNPDKQYIGLGSVKSQIGHTKGAAGAAGLIKVSLALYHKILPATINVTSPNPKLEIEKTPFYLNTEIRPWIKPADHPRRAGVSAFGFGGTNFHVALEEYQDEQKNGYRVQTTPQVIILSGTTPAELQANCQAWLAKFNGPDQKREFLNLVETVRSRGIPQTEARVGFVAGNATEAAKQLTAAIELVKTAGEQEGAENPAGIYYRKNGVDPKGKLVALFPGQGSQYVDMGRELALNFPTVRSTFAEMDKVFFADHQPALSGYVYPIPVFDSVLKDKQTEILTKTENAQPAIGTLSAAYYRLLNKAGFAPSFTAGHSFGELTALWAAGVYDDEAFFALTRARGKAMAPPADPNFDAGTMLAVKGNIENLQAELKNFPEITLANWNSNDQVVLAGSKPAIAAVQKALGEKGYSVVALPVSAAFHTPLVGHAQKPFADAIKKVKFNKPVINVFSNSTGKKHSSDPEQIRKSLSEHILNPVKFKDEIEAIYAEGGTIFVEFGPKGVLTNLVKNILTGKPHSAVALNPNPKKDSDRQFREAVAQLMVLGLDLGGYDPFQLPAKPFVEKKKSGISLMLGAGLYLSDKTRKAFANAIAEKNSLSLMPSNLPAPTAAMAATAPVESAVRSVTPSANNPASVSNQVNPSILSQSINQLQSLQSETLKAHTQFLTNDAEYAKIFGQLTQQELSLLANSPSQPALEQINIALQTLDHSMTQFHQHQSESLRVQEQYLRSQTDLINSLMQVTSVSGGAFNSTQEYARPTVTIASLPTVAEPTSPTYSSPVVKTNGNGHKPVEMPAANPVPAAAITQAAPSINAELLNGALLEIVSEKTGYPTEMLEMGMDMEADLGIDSIKRVEIMGAMQARFPELPKADADALSEMRTLGQIVSSLSASIPSATASVGSPAPEVVLTPSASPAQPVATGTALSQDELTGALLEIVSEKTGYPTEMLEMGMDMEADLGIDSIKRVEIMGAMQTRFPELPKADADALSEMRTLGQIVASMSTSSAPVIQPVAENKPAAAAQATPEILPADNSIGASVSVDGIKTALLEIVSEKTGYPTEMLEMGMDMEADLGIDSIKRVEIMGAMQARFPELPKAGADALAEMHTLGQIIEYLSNSSTTTTVGPATPAVAAASPSDQPDLPRGVVSLKSLPIPDHLDSFVEPGHVSLLLDDGTDLTPALADHLSEQGHNVIVLSLPDSLVATKVKLPASIQRIQLNDISESGLQSELETIQQANGPASVFIHLDPKPASPTKAFSEAEKTVVKTTFLIAKVLKDPLTRSAQTGFAAFLAVTHLDGELGLASSGKVEPVSGGLFGLVKTLNLEWEKVFCRAVDLYPGMDVKTAARTISAELYDSNRLLTEVSYNPQGRFTLVITEPTTQEA